ncbi:hypothetical protein BH24BAC1_BH24BAC1_28460 [soil metagenome]
MSNPDDKYPFFLELVKNLGFVKVKEEVIDKEAAINNLEQGLREVKLVEEGKLKSPSAEEFLDEL